MKSYCEKHYDVFKQCAVTEQSWVGNDVKKWWDFVRSKEPSKLCSGTMTRQELKDLCRNKKYSDEECVGAVMAWGGQNRTHGQTLFKRFEDIKPIVTKMRGASCDRIEAYRDFYKVWQEPKALGMGAAYFTKLIFFCCSDHKGYIMDQWTSKSINLLCGEEVVHLQNGIVTKKNNHKVYETFCQKIEDLAARFDVSGEEIEIALFSKGGRKKAAWRQYVCDQYGC